MQITFSWSSITKKKLISTLFKAGAFECDEMSDDGSSYDMVTEIGFLDSFSQKTKQQMLNLMSSYGYKLDKDGNVEMQNGLRIKCCETFYFDDESNTGVYSLDQFVMYDYKHSNNSNYIQLDENGEFEKEQLQRVHNLLNKIKEIKIIKEN